ncbi:FemAB family protein [Winogradskyella sp.]|uniref:FemAB family protein n=1 Tax=Winogradskyella sp. TaxID=1883156 RepID=UPI003F6CDAC8
MIPNAYQIEVYSENDFKLWNSFVAEAKNTTFLFHRNFMDYHKDRFNDHSLLIFHNHELIAVLPANKVGKELHSHQGLTYGGLVVDARATLEAFEHIFLEILNYLKANAFKTLVVKQLPDFYYTQPSFQLDLKKMSYKVYKSNMTLAIDLKGDLSFHKSKFKNYRKAVRNKVELRESQSFEDFWNTILIPKLKNKYNSKPVHTLAEISYLKDKFPEHIRQFNAYLNNEIIAGITIFDKGNVVKSQYGAASQIGEDNKATDYLFIELINTFKKEGKDYFSMGTVADDSEKGYNEGMLKQKQELGCKAFTQNIYKIAL